MSEATPAATEQAASTEVQTQVPANVDVTLASTKTEPAPAPAAAADEPAATEEAKTVAYEKTGNARVDYALGVIGTAGFGADHPAVVAAGETGDFSMLAHALKEKGVAGAEDLVTMLKAEYDADMEAEQKAQDGIKADIVELAGSEEHWNSVAQFIRENGTEDELGTLRELLGSPKTHKIAASYMLGLYANANGEREPAKSAVGSDFRGEPPQRDVSPLSRSQFAQEAQKLYRIHGDGYTQTPEYAALGRRLKA